MSRNDSVGANALAWNCRHRSSEAKATQNSKNKDDSGVIMIGEIMDIKLTIPTKRQTTVIARASNMVVENK